MNTQQQKTTRLVGQRFDYLGADLEHPFEILGEARKEEPVFYSERLGAWVLTLYEDVRDAAAHPALFSSGGSLSPLTPFTQDIYSILSQGVGFASTMINSDPPEHSWYRNPLNVIFESERIAHLEPVVQRVATTLLDAFPRDGTVDIVEMYAEPLPQEVLLSLFGIPPDHLPQMRKWTNEAFALTSTVFDLSQEAERQRQITCARSFVALQHSLMHLVEERQHHPGDDLVSHILLHQNAGKAPFSFQEVVMEAMGVMIAGHKTTTGLIGTAFSLLLSTPEWEHIVSHPQSIPVAIEECLRYDASVPFFLRVTTQPVTFGDVTIPAGQRVLLAYGSANRDETVFPQAGELVVARTPNRHQSFGYGKHFCAGAPLARLEARVAIQAFAERFPNAVIREVGEHNTTLQFRMLKRLLVDVIGKGRNV